MFLVHLPLCNLHYKQVHLEPLKLVNFKLQTESSWLGVNYFCNLFVFVQAPFYVTEELLSQRSVQIALQHYMLQNHLLITVCYVILEKIHSLPFLACRCMTKLHINLLFKYLLYESYGYCIVLKCTKITGKTSLFAISYPKRTYIWHTNNSCLLEDKMIWLVT